MEDNRRFVGVFEEDLLEDVENGGYCDKTEESKQNKLPCRQRLDEPLNWFCNNGNQAHVVNMRSVNSCGGGYVPGGLRISR